MDDPRTPLPPTAESAERALQPTDPPPDEPISSGKGVKETIESILIAFILAFVFRAFVVEAFVIPTGSMATTLMGAHMGFTCKECGYQFQAEFRSASPRAGEEIDIPSTRAFGRSFTIYCPNCRHKVAQDEAEEPFVRYGDRILVLKYLYIPWVSEPRRWDVVVFKAPTPVDGAPLYATNYIKRLIGLPGEELMILDGDIYVKDKNGEWEIQTKPRYAQDALWRIIYDHDHRPIEANLPPVARPQDRWTLPWVHAAGDGWETGDRQKSRVITFDNAAGAGRLWFKHDSVPRYDAMHAPGGYFTDWLAYDTTMNQTDKAFESGRGADYTLYTVSDLKLAFSYERKSGDGPLRAVMTKHDHKFVLEFQPGGVRLLHTPPGEGEREIPAVGSIDARTLAGPVRVEFSNVDYQVSVRLNDEVVFQTNRDQYRPNVDELLSRHESRRDRAFPIPSVSIEAAKQKAELSHVSLWRDVYYTPDEDRGMWHATPSRPVQLNGAEYFVMGDNSAASSDARYWRNVVDLPDERLHADAGRVPGRFMLGRAFFVYWPAGFRPLKQAPALVPDFGDMRLIH